MVHCQVGSGWVAHNAIQHLKSCKAARDCVVGWAKKNLDKAALTFLTEHTGRVYKFDDEGAVGAVEAAQASLKTNAREYTTCCCMSMVFYLLQAAAA